MSLMYNFTSTRLHVWSCFYTWIIPSIPYTLYLFVFLKNNILSNHAIRTHRYNNKLLLIFQWHLLHLSHIYYKYSSYLTIPFTHKTVQLIGSVESELSLVSIWYLLRFHMKWNRTISQEGVEPQSRGHVLIKDGQVTHKQDKLSSFAKRPTSDLGGAECTRGAIKLNSKFSHADTRTDIMWSVIA